MNNTFEEFSNALKSKFCEFQTSTFSVSFIISAIFINHKYLMIYYSDIDPYRKLQMLEYQGVCLWLPFLFALFYVYIYPRFAKGFYSKTLEFSNEFKNIKTDKLNKRTLDEEDRKSFIFEIEKLTKQLDEKEQFVSKMERKYKEKEGNLLASHRNEVSKHQADLEALKSEHGSLAAQLTLEKSKLTSEIEPLKSKISQIELEKEKLQLDNQNRIQETSRANSEKNSLFAIMRDIDAFQKLSTEKKIERLLLANIAYNQIDDLLSLEKGYTQRIRSKIQLPSRTTTTDEILLREIGKLGEADISTLSSKFHDLNENSLDIKIKKLIQEGKITPIQNTNHYCLTSTTKKLLDLK
jgi:hypothetical protein